jgi:hypothetical protein
MQIGIRINQDRLVSPLKKMTGTFPAPVDPLGISKTEVLKNSGKRYLGHLNGKMDMVAHQAKGVNAMAKPLDPFLDKKGKSSPRLIPIENDLACVAPQDDVIYRPRIMNSRLPSHQLILPNKLQYCKPDPR